MKDEVFNDLASVIKISCVNRKYNQPVRPFYVLLAIKNTPYSKLAMKHEKCTETINIQDTWTFCIESILIHIEILYNAGYCFDRACYFSWFPLLADNPLSQYIASVSIKDVIY